MRIARATSADAARIASLFDAYRVFYGEASDTSGAQQFLEERVARKESAVFYAAVDLKIVGFMQLYPLFSSVKLHPTLVLNDLFVLADERRNGIARSLLTQAREYAREIGAQSLFLQTGINNVAAQALYESEGYRRDVCFYRYDLQIV